MNRPTKSEEIFKKYCADRVYAVDKIPEGVEKTPDFLVSTSQGELIAEIKELTHLRLRGLSFDFCLSLRTFMALC
jgi:hypothetical protein